MCKKLTTGEFIHKAQSIHCSKYDYGIVEYVDSHSKIKIICADHGVFEQTPTSHLKGSGCPICSNLKVRVNKRNNVEFITSCTQKHKSKYDYTLTQYNTNRDRVKIICPIHGIFEQMAQNHLRGDGCPKCGGSEKLEKDNFIEKAIAVHGTKYAYELVDYVNARRKVEIICKIHGSFKQVPHSHLVGIGCPKCNSSKGEIKVRYILDSLDIKYEGQHRFKDCRDIYSLPFDFTIFHNNRIACIEYQGAQHYKHVNFNGKLSISRMQKNLEGVQRRDNIKHMYCINNNIPLLLLRYDEDTMIEQRIKDFVNSLAHFVH